MVRWGKLAIWLIVFVAYYLRLRGLFANSFHADEALFASWARHIAVWKDPLLVTQAIDKPPLLFYLQALFYPLQGSVEWAARLPNFIASVLLVPLTAVLHWRLYRESWGMVVTAVVITFSPLAIQFSSTAFTDPLLTFWLVLSFVKLQCANGRRTKSPVIPSPGHPFIAGLSFGLAAATKYQAWLFLPFLASLGWLAGYGRRRWLKWLVGLTIIVGMVLLWDYIRAGTFSVWANQVGNFGGIRLIRSWELWPRLVAWQDLWQAALSPLLLLLFLLSILMAFVNGIWHDDGYGRVDWLLALFLTGYMLLHWLLAVPVWDRYLLPLLPLVAILVGRAIMMIRNWLINNFKVAIFHSHNRLTLAIVFLLIIILILPAWAARHGSYPLGGTPQADDGAAAIADHLQDAPYGTVLYDHWYSWQWRYHLFDRGVYVSWFPHGKALTRDLAVFGQEGHDRYLVLPETAVADPILRVVRAADFRLQFIAREGRIKLYKIVPAEVRGD